MGQYKKLAVIAFFSILIAGAVAGGVIYASKKSDNSTYGTNRN